MELKLWLPTLCSWRQKWISTNVHVVGRSSGRQWICRIACSKL